MLTAALLLVCDERMAAHVQWVEIKQNFIKRNKMEVDSWAGDMFANVYRKMGIPLHFYEEFRNEFFK